jgi:CubicO group peptidase (beta-lactamase class C family)
MADGQVVACAADGERKRGSGVPIELGDRWHLGSITKSITTTMIARLVESGQMKWTDTVGERFSDASIHEGESGTCPNALELGRIFWCEQGLA